MPIGGNISSGSAPAIPLWTVEYELDLTAQTDHDFTSGGDGSTLSMGDVTWTAYNEGASDKFETSSAGLEIDPKGDGSHLWAGVQTLPYLAAPLTSMMAGLSEDDTIALQLYMDSSPVPSAASDAYGLALWNGISPTSSEYLCLRYTVSGANRQAQGFLEQESYDAMDQSTAQTFFEIVLYPGNGAVSNMGVFDTEFPDPLTSGTFQAYSSLSPILGPGGGAGAIPSWKIPKLTASFMILAQRNNSATTLLTTAYKMRVLRRRNA
tara:strand:- start:108 stop:902 length:795 start_codon:yes stop_codon:yes gene_type:complete